MNWNWIELFNTFSLGLSSQSAVSSPSLDITKSWQGRTQLKKCWRQFYNCWSNYYFFLFSRQYLVRSKFCTLSSCMEYSKLFSFHFVIPEVYIRSWKRGNTVILHRTLSYVSIQHLPNPISSNNTLLWECNYKS